MDRTSIENLTRTHMTRQRTAWSLSLIRQNDKAELVADVGVQILNILWADK